LGVVGWTSDLVRVTIATGEYQIRHPLLEQAVSRSGGNSTCPVTRARQVELLPACQSLVIIRTEFQQTAWLL
jgi:hypothetical protein